MSGGTDNHLMLVDLKEAAISGRELEERLDSVRITVNKNMVPGDTRSPRETSGIRVGTPAVTTRGFRESEMAAIAKAMAAVARDFEGNCDAVRQDILELTQRFPIYKK